MMNLVLRSILVLALLFGLLFAVGMVVSTALGLPIWVDVVYALGVVLLQYLLGPWIVEWVFAIRWLRLEDLPPALAAFVRDACPKRGIPLPRFGLIRDGNPNAFTLGHWPRNARVVVTQGLLDLLSPEEQQAVVAHELGHIAHWDFVVMTIATAVPLLLYILAESLRPRAEKALASIDLDDLTGSLATYLLMFIMFIWAHIAYLVSEFLALLLSRLREYFADQFSASLTGNPDRLASALVKIAYGLAGAPKGAQAKKDDRGMLGARSFGIFDPKMAQSLALVGAGGGQASAAGVTEAMKWDLWNPWSKCFELTSSHPLPAKRLRALEEQASAMGRPSQYAFRKEQPESYWDEFLADLGIMLLPLIGAVVGLVVASSLPCLGILLYPLILGAFCWAKLRRVYPPRFAEERTIGSLVGEVKASPARPIPCTIRGTIIGRGVPGLFYSEDLVLQDDTGFIILDYRQPLRIFEVLFGWRKAGELIGRKCTAQGWYRRAPGPVFEVRQMSLEERTNRRWLNEYQQDALLQAVARTRSKRDRAIIMFMLNAGLQTSEVANVKLEDIEISPQKGSVTLRGGEGEKDRIVPLTEVARKAIEGYLEERPKKNHRHLFLGVRGGPMEPTAIDSLIQRLAHDPWLSGMTPEMLRHTFVKDLLDDGESVARVAQLLGYDSATLVQMYATSSELSLQGRQVPTIVRSYYLSSQRLFAGLLIAIGVPLSCCSLGV